MLVSYSPTKTGILAASEAASYVQISYGIHAAADQGQGKIRPREGEIIDLQFESFSDQAQWLEVVYKFGGGSWLKCNRFFFRIQAATDHEIAMSLALRVHRDDGFDDIFAVDKLHLSADPNWVGAEVTIPAWALQRCVSLDAHLFLPPQDGGIRIYDFSAMGAR